MQKKLDHYRPSPFFVWSVHLDGDNETHDRSVGQTGVYDRAVAVQREQRRVLLASGQALDYGHLVLATGARNRVPPLPGVVAKDDRTVVFTLNAPATYFTDMLALPSLSPSLRNTALALVAVNTTSTIATLV